MVHWSSARTTAACAAIAAIAVAFWYVRLVVPGHEPFNLWFNGDFYTQIYPMEQRAAVWIREGVLPLWNPFQFCGHPVLAAGLYGVLYPLNIAYLLFSTSTAIEVSIVLHLALAGIFTYLYCCTIGLRVLPALLAAVVFMLSGFVASQASWFPPAMGAAAWLPLGLLGIERLMAGGAMPWCVVVAMAVAMPFLAGWPQTWLYSCYTLASYAVVCTAGLVRGARGRILHAGGLVALGFVLGLGLIAIQLLPQLELQSLGPRHAGALSIAQSLIGLPYAPKQMVTDLFDSHPASPRLPYVGIGTLVLIPLAVAFRARRSIYFTFAGVMSLAIAVTVFTPIFTLYRILPGMAWFRVPVRILYVWAFAAAVLAGGALHAMLGSRVVGRRWTTLATCVATIASVCALCLLARPVPWSTPVYLTVSAALLVALVAAPGPSSRMLLGTALVVVVALDLFRSVSNPFLRPYHNPGVFDQERALFDYIRTHQDLDRTYIHNMIDSPGMMGKDGSLFGVYSITDYEPLSLGRFASFFAVIEGRAADAPRHLPFVGRLRANPAMQAFALLDLMSVRYVIAHRLESSFTGAIGRRAPKWHLVQGVQLSPDYLLYRNADPLPRAYVAYRNKVTHDAGKALAAITRADFDPRATVVLEDEDAIGGPSPEVERTLALSPASIVRYTPREVTIEADAIAPGHLVLTDTFYPGWTVSVDDQPAQLLRANYLFRAVALAPGHHIVTLRYRPASFRIGALITAMTLIGVGVIVARNQISRRQRRAEASAAIRAGSVSS